MPDRTRFFRRAAVLTCWVPVALSLLAGPAPVLGAPEPSVVPSRWQLDFRPGELHVATYDVQIPVTAPDGTVTNTVQPRTYLYLTYEVVNTTGENLLFAPSFELATEETGVIRSGRGVPSSVVTELLEDLKNPFLEDEISVIRTLEQGTEYAREGLVVWPAETLKSDEIKIFAKGFSGETKSITRPDTGEKVTLYKVMMLRYETPGDVAAFGPRPIPLAESRWILR